MYPNSFSISSLLALFFFLFALIGVPNTLCVDDPRFSDCRTTIRCGSTAFDYPFWGMNRANYCGPPGFELKCEDEVAKITMGQNTLRILDVNPRQQILHVAREDYWNGYCPTELINTTIDFNHFDFGSNLRNLTLFYGCLTSLLNFITNCTINGVYVDVSYAIVNPLVDPRPAACYGSVIVPIYEAAAQNLVVNPLTVNDALKGGFELQWEVDSDQCRRCTDSDGVCGYNQTTNSFICFCRDQPSETTCSPTTQDTNKQDVSLPIGLAIAGAAIVGILLGMGILRYRQQRRKKIADQDKSRDLPTPPSSTSKGPPTSTTNLSQSIPSYPTSNLDDLEKRSTYFGAHVFRYEELEEATDNFNPSKELGEGGFGTVYYGVLNDGRVVAVKRLFESNFKRVDQYMNEIEILTRIRHPNLVTLYGCTSRRSRELLLVYEYIPNGTVADHLHGKLSNSGLLAWPVRLSIAVETANALAYLHSSDIIHRDVKTNNILLDKDCHVKVADFGLSRLFPNDVTHVSTAPQGTPGYVDPEYYQCYQLTEKSDVYSFGVVLIELISAKQAVDTNRHRHDINLANMAISRIQNHALHELVDPSLGFENDHALKTMITAIAELAFRCLQQERDMRPSMEEVLEALRGIKDGELVVKKAEIVDITSEAEVVDIRSEADVVDIRSEADVVDIRSDDVGLLKHIPPPLSPDSETDKWLQIRSM
ncbi:LEAF RUST 10 DISEASE-RESISTANCE LOCUS RECEPTOR-LIKE PROTEIN KINASE-like 1.4 isoform X2 [Durio zibethinus]|uniref:non-specific serine/threonine protein kinase n=1 Tax=Durio zibethinus TaxID=66656 RepID=A0A6P6A3H3_DURZI|nr:LEAF RUST 10 DISEASE-RESISTANCE LOCUS RECEPTOR-LIKE PROTEIN KINASE-like 1.4 isoform X2 [Durio zibethinus]